MPLAELGPLVAVYNLVSLYIYRSLHHRLGKVPQSREEEAILIAKAVAEATTVGDPEGDFYMGPVVNEIQWQRIQELIQSGIAEGATLVTGGLGRPEGLSRGFYVRPTIFANVRNEMRVSQEEIFGPVVVIISYDTIPEAIQIANDTKYGLAAYISGVDQRTIDYVASKLRAGQVTINWKPMDFNAPFGGYKMSGNGREWGIFGLSEYLETKAIIGAGEQIGR